MGIATKLVGTAAGVAGAAGAAAALGVVRRRRTIEHRAGGEPGLGSLHSPSRTVIASDGVPLYVEVDEIDSPSAGDTTMVFVHGYTLSLDCWHFQRAAFRGLVRTVFYDQRSHGQSGRSEVLNATIEQLGEDLLSVLDQVAGDGPIVLVGHSMGGMTLIALAESHPELFAPDGRIRGVCLISTTAGGLNPMKRLPFFPQMLSRMATSGSLRTLSRSHRAVDGVRKVGRGFATVITDAFAFGDDVPASYVEFVDSMISATPFEVVAEFFPRFAELDKFEVVVALSRVPTTIICGTSDRLTSIGHSRKLHSVIEGSRLIECPGAGHMVILERYGQVNAALDQLLAAAT
jgi:pimeloyl-ACP methyl ester carboxylesterase